MRKVRLHLQQNPLNLTHIDAVYECFTGFTLPTPGVEWYGAKGLVITPSSIRTGQPLTFVQKGTDPMLTGTTLFIKEIESL